MVDQERTIQCGKCGTKLRQFADLSPVLPRSRLAFLQGEDWDLTSNYDQGSTYLR